MYSVKEIEEVIKQKNIKAFVQIIKNSSMYDLSQTDYKTGFNALHTCINLNATNELKLLLSQYPDFDLNKKSNGVVPKTALDLAGFNKNTQITKILLEGGVNVTEDDISKLELAFKQNPMFVAYLSKIKNKRFPKEKLFWFF